MAVENITLNLIPTGDTPSIHVAQFDVERPFTVTLKEGEDDFTPTGYDIELQVRKVDNNIVTTVPAQTSGNVVTFNTTEQMTACSGTNLAELQLTKESQTFATLHFYLVVQRDVLAGGATSESDIYNLTEQIAAIVPEVIGDDYYNKEEVDEKIAEIPTFDPTNYYDKSDVNSFLNDKANTADLAPVAFSGDYNDLENKPDIPDVSNYYTKSEVDTKISNLYQIKTISGDTVHIIDGGNNIPVNSFECAIGSAGFSQADITVCGVNLFNTNFSDYSRPSDYRIFPIKLKQGATYNYSAKLIGTAQTGFTIGVARKGDRYVNFGPFYTICNGTDNTGSFTVDSTFTDPKLIVYANTESAFNAIFENYEIQLNEGDLLPYTQYIGTTYIVEFGSIFNDGVLKYENGSWYIDVSGAITPITSSTRIKSISGENNIFSNTGDIEVGYFTEKSDGIAELIKAFK